MIDARAVGGAYRRVMVNGAEFSRHTTIHKAGETAYDVALEALRQVQAGTLAAFPSIEVVTDERVVYEVDPSVDPVTIPAPTTPPTSGGGEDLIDFIERNTATPTVFDVVHASSFEAALPVFAEQHKQDWLLHRIYRTNADGSRTWAGIGWRGYLLVWLYRDKTALTVGGAS